ncbi:MAG: polyprenyl synthetase family protein [Actinomycetaceae bacterium]|nr:polyprenyl synthetase family protein [Actinomycetaceae bacterium]
MSPLSATFTSLRPSVDSATTSALLSFLDLLPSSAQADPLFEAAHGACASGKRFRGILSMVGADLVAGQAQVDTKFLAAAVELYQASALVHDDVIDNADTRRGNPTPHVAMAHQHRTSGWVGSPQNYGVSAAILLGDVLFSAASWAMAQHCRTVEPLTAARVWDTWNQMHAEVGVGQFLDIQAEQVPLNPEDDSCVSVEHALQVVVHKSARYSVVVPTVLGALSAGADEHVVAQLEAVLTPWGQAFQLRDDDLGVFGDPHSTGKPAGDDLVEGKRTALLALTWRGADRAEREALMRVVGNPQAEQGAIQAAVGIIDQRGRSAHEEMISHLVEQGNQALMGSTFTADIRQGLSELGEIVTRRRA